jgi:hypothetical protein
MGLLTFLGIRHQYLCWPGLEGDLHSGQAVHYYTTIRTPERS